MSKPETLTHDVIVVGAGTTFTVVLPLALQFSDTPVHAQVAR